ncbi:MAG TPA: CPBP family intramembrane glutamic endopeptidase [Candidatus Polarisedimenticolaceae bacterium]|nr:CPBP family intramembrane glutamic endopeptidase [Candidatus Polarisedimenticolaceae bacterium]
MIGAARWRPSRRSAVTALALLVPAPSIGVLVALSGPTDESGATTTLAQAVWLLSKLWILLLPVAWHRFVDGRAPRVPRPAAAGMPAAVLSGALFAIVITSAYATLGRRWIDVGAAGERIAAAGLDSLPLYAGMALYWCTVNSLLEEYVWRWFVFTRCEAVRPGLPAVLAAGLFFTLHHTIALAAFFDDARTVVLASIGIWVAGASWSWIYLRWRNIYAAWLSHALADLAIFWIGYRIVFAAG